MSSPTVDSTGQDETIRMRNKNREAARGKVAESIRVDEEMKVLTKEGYEKEEPTGPLVLISKLLRYSICICICILLFYLKRGGEVYRDAMSVSQYVDVNPYMVLGVKKQATKDEIKLAYKKLVRQWHPDKNTGCTNCEMKVQSFKEAFTILGDDKARREYDMSRTKTSNHIIDSTYSIEMDDNNYQSVMNKLYDTSVNTNPMVLQVYDPLNEASKGMASLWDATAERVQEYKIDFVRLNARTEKVALKNLPNKIVQYPTIMLMERDTNPLIFNLSKSQRSNDLQKWIRSSLALNNSFRTLTSTEDIQRWIQETSPDEGIQGLSSFPDDMPRIIVLSNKTISNAMIRRIAMRYKGIAHIGKMTLTKAPKEIKDLRLYGTDVNLVLLKGDLSSVEKTSIVKGDSADEYFKAMFELTSNRALPLTSVSIAPLCSSDIAGTRILCNVNIVNTTKDIRILNKFSRNKSKYERSKGEEDDYVEWIFQNVYITDSDSQSSKNLKKMLTGEQSLLLDIGAFRFSYSVPTASMIESLKVPEIDSLDFLPFSSSNENPCLMSYNAFVEQCIPSGSMATLASIKYWFYNLGTMKLLVLLGFIVVIAALTLFLSVNHWLMIVFFSSFILQLFL